MSLFRRVRSLRAKYQCSVCNCRVIAFDPLPEFYVENMKKHGYPFTFEEAETCNHLAYLCPHCQASDRDRLYALYLKNYLASLPVAQEIKLIDFSPSTPLSSFIREQISRSQLPVCYRTADYSGVGVDDKVDITDLQNYGNDEFHFLICSHVLEHVTDDRRAMRELNRILKPGGKGIIMVPIILGLNEIDEDPTVTDEGERWRRFGQDDHVRLYSKPGFIQRLGEAGFRVCQYGIKSFGDSSFFQTGITDQSVLYVVEK